MSEEKAVAEEMMPDLSDIFVMLADAALSTRSIEQVMDDLNSSLNARGFAIARAHLTTPSIHTIISGYSITWRPGAPPERADTRWGVAPSKAWRESPFSYMLLSGMTFMRQALDRSKAPFAFPVLQEFADEGMTDWMACAESFEWLSDHVPGGRIGTIASWTTRREGGFTAQEQNILRRLAKPFAAAVKVVFLDMIARDVLATYLGRDAATRVLSGAITRGGVTQIPAVVMISDIKGFTRLSLTHPIAHVVGLLNDTFDVMAEAIERHQGHVLKFMGDGILSIFLLEGDAGDDAASRALAAADEIRSRLPDHVRVDTGLSIGEVHYGNVGSASRLDFTAIGPAVNEAARLEGLCEAVGQPILMVGRVASLASEWGARLRPLGLHVLRGSSDPRMVFALE